MTEWYTYTTQNRAAARPCGFKSHLRYKMSDIEHNKLSAYVVGLAIGDGNLSNPNGRATRLRITCCSLYPKLIGRIQDAVQRLFPENKVSITIREGNCVDVSCYSNKLEKLLGWRVGHGSKAKQNVTIPDWILENETYALECLRGLLETDGSVYLDRGYKMVNFTTIIKDLALQVESIISRLGFLSHTYVVDQNGVSRYTIRVSKNCEKFIEIVHFNKD